MCSIVAHVLLLVTVGGYGIYINRIEDSHLKLLLCQQKASPSSFFLWQMTAMMYTCWRVHVFKRKKLLYDVCLLPWGYSAERACLTW
jgi:hypothetical protein